jgi:hypothetical protein
VSLFIVQLRKEQYANPAIYTWENAVQSRAVSLGRDRSSTNPWREATIIMSRVLVERNSTRVLHLIDHAPVVPVKVEGLV